MAKIALIIIFSLIMVISIRSVVAEDALSPEQIDKAASGFKEATQTVSSAAGTAAESVKDTASSWTDWAKDKLRGYGWMSPDGSGSASAPASSPAPAYSRSFGPGPIAPGFI